MSTTFSIKRTVQFSETDMAGIVHFANFFRMMEEVEHAYFRSLGLSVCMEYQGEHIGWPRVATNCEYLGPVRFEDHLELRFTVLRVGEKSFSYEVEFLLGEKRMALGTTTSVCCSVAGGKMKSIPIPAEMREKLSASRGTE
jgi:YbgC/YbaW family acyl-CoA thioester hydrolase